MMIARLQGILVEKELHTVVVDVGGVGYAVTCSSRTLDRLPALGAPVLLVVETQFRAEHLELFGFESAEERQWFRVLQTVQGVGARVALAIQSALTADELTQAILAQDAKTLTRADGVGPKLAARMVMELKDKIPTRAFTVASPLAKAGAMPPAASSVVSAQRDAVDALVGLGYRRADVESLMPALARDAEASEGAETTVEELVKQGLRRLARTVTS